MKILFCEADAREELSTSIWLCRIPAEAINRSGKGKHQARVIHINQFVQGQFDMDWPDIAVVERILTNPVIKRIEECQAKGIKVMARFDDAYHLMPSYISSALLWRRNLVVLGIDEASKTLHAAKMQESMRKQFSKGLRTCDAVSAPSRLLCQDYERAARKMFFIPNFPDLGNPAWTAPKPQHEGIIVGWGGGGTHKQSIEGSGILYGLRKICAEFPQVKVMICGKEDKERFVKELPEGRLITQDWVPTEEWPYTVAKFDIGLAPLSGSYDDRRSWVKVLDYSVLGIPWIASDRPPYQGCYGGIKVKNKAKSWYRAIRTLLMNPGKIEMLINVGKAWAWRCGIDQHISTYLNVFDEILKG